MEQAGASPCHGLMILNTHRVKDVQGGSEGSLNGDAGQCWDRFCMGASGGIRVKSRAAWKATHDRAGIVSAVEVSVMECKQSQPPAIYINAVVMDMACLSAWGNLKSQAGLHYKEEVRKAWSLGQGPTICES
eukprot:1161525-Pelagomonas_calceolata.AAC.21